MQSCWSSMLDACTYACACSRVCMLSSCVLVSWIHDVDVATDVLGSVFRVQGSGFKVHSRSLLKKKWSDARAV